MKQCRAGIRLFLAVCLIIMLFLAVGSTEEPPQENETAMTAATVAASMEYDRVLELFGDSGAARAASERVFREVLEQWPQP